MPALPPGRAHGHPARWGAASSRAVHRHLARAGGVLAGHPLPVIGWCLDLRRRGDPTRRCVGGRRRTWRRRDRRIAQDARHGDSTQRGRPGGRDRHGRWLVGPSGPELRRPGARLSHARRRLAFHYRTGDRRGRCGFLQAARSRADPGLWSGGTTDRLTLGRFGSRSRRCAPRGHGPACQSSRPVGDRNHWRSVVPQLVCPSRSFCLMSSGDARRCADRPRHRRLGWCGEQPCWTGPPLSPNPLACAGRRRHGPRGCGWRGCGGGGVSPAAIASARRSVVPTAPAGSPRPGAASRLGLAPATRVAA